MTLPAAGWDQKRKHEGPGVGFSHIGIFFRQKKIKLNKERSAETFLSRKKKRHFNTISQSRQFIQEIGYPPDMHKARVKTGKIAS